MGFTAVTGTGFAFGAATFFALEATDFVGLVLETDLAADLALAADLVLATDLALPAGLRFATDLVVRFLAAPFLAGEFDPPVFRFFATDFLPAFLATFFTAFFAVFLVAFALDALRPRAFDAAALARFGARAFFTVFFFDLAALAITRPSAFATMPTGSRSHEALRAGGVHY
ncbi:MAG: hypothetical protein BGO65_05085 [Afipia sp. 64-13]|nr:MAG: hypothetical protein BGO65_05085 [Afipia sp. 64-13]